MNILGINYLSESTVSIIKNGKLIFALSEERLNRKKIGMAFLMKVLKLQKKY